MKLSNEVKNKIIDLIDVQLKDTTYEGLTKERRDELGQFYTPAKLCIQTIEKYEVDSFSGMNILDPTCGSGNLLIAMLIAGADSDKLFGNEYDECAVKLCRRRIQVAINILNEECFLGRNIRPFNAEVQIHQGNALHEFALTYFEEDYNECYFDNRPLDEILNNPTYNAYIHSSTFETKYPIEYRQHHDANAQADGYAFSLLGMCNNA